MRIAAGCKRAAVPSACGGASSVVEQRAQQQTEAEAVKGQSHCSNPLVTGSNPVGGATFRELAYWLLGFLGGLVV